MHTPQTAVVILNWNGKHLLERFLPGIIANTPEGVELIVADNASDDGSVAFLEAHHPQVRLILLDKNYGYAGGYNRALEQVDAKYYVLLNSDMQVTAGWLQPCIGMMEEDHGLVAVQPKIRSLENPQYFEHAGAAGGFLDQYGFPFCRGRIFQTVERDEGQYDDAVDIFWASGAALFVRSTAFHEVGGFDARFFAHMEEIDLCWRFHHRGYRVRYCPQSVLYHLGGGSLPPSSPRKTYLNFRNSLWMLAKNLSGRKFCKLILFRYALDELAAFRFLIKGQGKNLVAVARAWYALISNRKALRKHSRHVPREMPKMLYRHSIVIQYYVLRRKYFSDLRFRASTARK